MRRLCMRSKCDRPAQVRLTYDTISCQVWLDSLPERTGLVHEICEFHAKRITLPVGWKLSDRRTSAPRLFDLDLTESRPPLPKVAVDDTDEVGCVAGGETVRRPGPDRRKHPRTWPPRRAPKLVGGRHPSLSASELFGVDLDDGTEHSQGAVPQGAGATSGFVTSTGPVVGGDSWTTSGLAGRGPSGSGLPSSGLADAIGAVAVGVSTATPTDLAAASASLGSPTSDTGEYVTPEESLQRRSTPTSAFDDGYMSIVSYGSSSIERVIMLDSGDANQPRGA